MSETIIYNEFDDEGISDLFICGQSTKKDVRGFPDRIIVGIQEGSDVCEFYERIKYPMSMDVVT